jgi:hypothetical protein
MSTKMNIKKAIRTLRLAENDFVPYKYWVYEVKVAKGVVKRFVSMKDAKTFVKNQTALAKTFLAAKRALAATA